jgi:hypothetical protein
MSGLGIADLMTQSLGQFKVANEQKNFNFVHCWTALKDCPKWLYVSYDANMPDIYLTLKKLSCVNVLGYEKAL